MKKLNKFFSSLRLVKWWKWLILGIFTTILIVWFVWINSGICMGLLKDMGNVELGGVEYTYHMLYAISTFTMIRCCIYATLISFIYFMYKSILNDMKGGTKNE